MKPLRWETHPASSRNPITTGIFCGFSQLILLFLLMPYNANVKSKQRENETERDTVNNTPLLISKNKYKVIIRVYCCLQRSNLHGGMKLIVPLAFPRCCSAVMQLCLSCASLMHCENSGNSQHYLVFYMQLFLS